MKHFSGLFVSIHTVQPFHDYPHRATYIIPAPIKTKKTSSIG
ncbi:hypothetical protein [Hoylesella timonensis]|nr:hypothetical protein [Hoylesella timonensis]